MTTHWNHTQRRYPHQLRITVVGWIYITIYVYTCTYIFSFNYICKNVGLTWQSSSWYILKHVEIVKEHASTSQGSLIMDYKWHMCNFIGNTLFTQFIVIDLSQWSIVINYNRFNVPVVVTIRMTTQTSAKNVTLASHDTHRVSMVRPPTGHQPFNLEGPSHRLVSCLKASSKMDTEIGQPSSPKFARYDEVYKWGYEECRYQLCFYLEDKSSE